MTLAKNSNSLISEQDYLSGERTSDIKHKYISGEIYAMAGASKNHNLLSLNISSEIRNKLKEKVSPCNVFNNDMKVKITSSSNNYFYPDAMVVCNSNTEDDYYQNSPLITVEVLSKSTSKFDKSQKRMYYLNIPSLREYVLIEQDKCEVVVFEKDNGWQPSYYFIGDEITF